MIMRNLVLLLIFFITVLNAEKIKVEAEKFSTDEKKGLTVFTGNVIIEKGNDEINASKITIYTDAEHRPTQIVAVGNVSFFIETETGDTYAGRSQRAVLKPLEKSYHFFTNVHLKQLNRHQEIDGDEVYVNTLKGTAIAKGAEKKPVIMVFDIAEKDKTK